MILEVALSGRGDIPDFRAFAWKGEFSGRRDIRFRLEGTRRLPDWPASAGGASRVFVGEIVVR